VTALIGLAGVPAASASSSSAEYQTISYHGYQIQVPASWPVYNLATDPTRCVLFNQHAVYLGTPGANEQCPTRAYGRTEAVLVQPETTSIPAGSVELGADTASFSGALNATEATAHTVQFTAPGPGVQVTASYGSDEAQIRSILAGAQMTAKTTSKPPTVSAAPQAASGEASSSATGATGATGHAAASGGGSSSKTTAKTEGKANAGSAAQASDGWQLSEMQGQGLGVDTCTVPSIATMTHWLASPYRVISTYLGGANWACTYGDFTDGWVTQAAAEGWQFIPIWVGPQASCTQLTGTTVIDPADAAAQGTAEAASAVAAAQEFGYGQGTPIYYDMESYDNSDTSCSQATLTFLGAWTAGLHSAGYLSGVYSSASTGIADLVSQYGNGTYQSPDDVWAADWNGDPIVGNPHLPATDWPGATLHQYYGSHDETWGGDTLNVDSNVVDGAVAGYPIAAVSGQPTLTAEPAEVSVAPGSNGGGTQLQIQGGGQPAVVQWHADPPAGVSVSPSSGVGVIAGNGQISISLKVSGAATLGAGRYDVPITASANGRQVAETYVLVTSGSATPSPIVLYAADADSMTIAQAEAQGLGLPAGSVTGDFSTAWTDASSGSDLVITVGAAASDALFHNACGWTNPAGEAAGHTPFGFSGAPLTTAASGVYEAADGSTDAAVQAESEQFAQYALAGTIPNENAAQPLGEGTPADTCLGSPDVPLQ
jgi:hypothetical protein